jgi:hypothetical protein
VGANKIHAIAKIASGSGSQQARFSFQVWCFTVGTGFQTEEVQQNVNIEGSAEKWP